MLLIGLLCRLVAIPIGFAGSRLAKTRRQNTVVPQAGMILALGTIGVWVVVVAVALRKGE
jgi:hypothetical protein